MKYDCGLIQDLIPLVKDGVASDNSKTAVDYHIRQCPVCKGIYATNTQIAFPTLNESANTEISKVTDYKNRIKKRRKIIIILTVVFSVFLVIGTAATTAQIAKYLAGDSYSTRSIADYGNYSGHIEAEQEGLFSLLEIFPKEIPASAEVKDYYYFCNNGRLDNSYQLYLLCAYEESDFIIEKERLESIEISFRDEVHKPIITDTGFNYRAIVTIFDDQNSFEYALIDDDTNTVAYVFAQSMGIDKSVVSSQYHPRGFNPPKDRLTELGSFNMYRFKLNDDMPGSSYVIPGINHFDE